MINTYRIAKSEYILSLEAAQIYEHQYRGKDLIGSFVGMLPSSLNNNKLNEKGIKTFDSKRYNKTLTQDIINIKFTQKVRSGQEIVDTLIKKINDKNKEKLEPYIKQLESVLNKPEYQEVKIDDTVDKNTHKVNKGLRTLLYENGFIISEKNEKTGEIKETHYVVYMRSSAKSRHGQVLFIRKELRDRMIRWSRMGMNLEGRDDIDFPSLLSYESLISSSIERLININVNNILIVDDVKSIFPCDVNVVEKNKDGILVSNPMDNYKMESDIFDGEGLLDSSYFDGSSMMLLRQHMFKSCVFNTNIKEFLNDYARDHNIDFDTWELKNMFGESILAKEVRMIVTPNSLKALKFFNIKGTKKKMWQCWKEKLQDESCMFGVVKVEHESKRGINFDGNIVNQTSYQMLNSMPINFEAMKDLSCFELQYIEKLKNDNDTYVQYLDNNANEMNCNKMLVDLYKHNNKIAATKIFKDKRKKDIHNYVEHIKKGKLRLVGDYCTILQNGKEYLYHAIGKLPVDKGILQEDLWKNQMILNGNEVYAKLHKPGEYVAFRNPHTSPSNVLIVNNKKNTFIDKYFNLGNNIIYTNAIHFPINRILSGQDADSDSLILFSSSTLLSNAHECYGHYRVCVNGVKKDTNKYTVCNSDMAKIDSILAKSQKFIGSTVNLGQLFMSTYWDLVNKGVKDEDKEQLTKLLQAVDVCTVLSEISIDSAKRLYDINIKEQIESLSKSNLLRDKKPLFFQYVSQDKKIKGKVEKYETSMDYLQKILNSIKAADDITPIPLTLLLSDFDPKKVKNRQVNGILNIIDEMTKKVKAIESEYKEKEYLDKEEDNKEKYTAIDNIENEYLQKVKHYKIKIETIYVIIKKIFSENIKFKYKVDLLNTLYKVNNEMFIKTFKSGKI